MFSEHNVSCSFSLLDILHTAITITIHYGNWIHTTWGVVIRKDSTSRDSVYSFHSIFFTAEEKQQFFSIHPALNTLSILTLVFCLGNPFV